MNFLIFNNISITKEMFFSHVEGLKKEFSGLETESKVALHLKNPFDFLICALALSELGHYPFLMSDRWSEFQKNEILKKYNIQISINKVPTYLPQSSSVYDLNPDGTLVFFTSGSTSEPKPAVLTVQNLILNALGANENLLFHERHEWALNLPLYHVGGMGIFFRALVGSGQVSLDGFTKSTTHTSMVSTQLYRFLKENNTNELHSVLLGGSAFSDNLIQSALDQGLPLYKSYGLTEMGSQVTTTGRNSDLHTSGHLLNYRDLKIHNTEIFVKGPTLFQGFYSDDGIIPCTDSDGWYRTKDLGKFDDNNLIILGRHDRMFVSAGENVQPEMIERAILKYPRIIRAKVIPKDDQEYGKIPVAFIDSDTQLNVEDLKEFLRSHLSGIEMPKDIYSFSEIPPHLLTAKD